MAGEDLIVPAPPIGPDDLGLPPAPTPPTAPALGAPPEDFKQKLMRLLAIGVAGGLGPGAGTGMLQGLSQADQRRDLLQRQTDQIARQTFQTQQTAYAQQQRLYEADAARRQQTIQQNLDRLRQVAPTLKDKAVYDQYIDAYSAGLQRMGMRISGNWLRQAVPYVAPTAKDEAAKVLDAFLKNPTNQTLLQEHPEQIDTIVLRFDRDGDGVIEQVKLTDVATIAEMPFATDATGKLVVYPKGTTKDLKANADGILQSLLEQDKAEGKAPTPQRQIELQQQAIKLAAEAKPQTTDPTLAAIRDLQLQQLKNAPKETYPPHVQRRIDQKAKAFDMQPAVKRTQLMAEAVTFANALSDMTTNPADDIGLLYAFAKANDPDSVVREGEYATVQKYAQSWAEQFGFAAARIFSNTAFLTPQARRNMKATIRTKFQAGQGQYNNLRRSYAAQIDRITGQPGAGDLELVDYGAAFPSEPEETPSAPSSGAPSYEDYLKRRQGAR